MSVREVQVGTALMRPADIQENLAAGMKSRDREGIGLSVGESGETKTDAADSEKRNFGGFGHPVEKIKRL